VGLNPVEEVEVKLFSYYSSVSREVVSAGGDLEGRWHVGISIERPRGYLRNRFRN
jgi:hypothetical protein